MKYLSVGNWKYRTLVDKMFLTKKIPVHEKKVKKFAEEVLVAAGDDDKKREDWRVDYHFDLFLGSELKVALPVH